MFVIRLKRILPVVIAVFVLIGSIALSMEVNKLKTQRTNSNQAETQNPLQDGSDSKKETDSAKIEEKSEMRAVWVPYMSLDLKGTDKSEQAFKNKFDSIVAESKHFGANTLIVHVRPYGDSFYKSEVFPWSHFLMGVQGQDPGYDPLKYMIEATHKSGMKFHAWVNPFRIQTKENPEALSANNLYNIWKSDADSSNDDFVVDCSTGKYYNPAYPQVQAKIIAGVREIAKNYAVDGIQFDDYFYPTTDESFDKQVYDKYCSKMSENGKALTLEEFRKSNINTLISGVYSAIKSENSNVQFGISPQCNVQNDLKMGADVYAWGSTKGYVDYLCPQFYVSFEHPFLPFDKSVSEWKSIITNSDVKFYYGLALYKCGSDSDSGTWKNSNEIIKRQIEYGRANNCNGFMFYAFDYLKATETSAEIENAKKVL